MGNCVGQFVRFVDLCTPQCQDMMLDQKTLYKLYFEEEWGGHEALIVLLLSKRCHGGLISILVGAT